MSPIHAAVLLLVSLGPGDALESGETITASSSSEPSRPGGARDGERFSVEPGKLWRGLDGQTAWWWQLDLGSLRPIGAILQVHGDHAFVLQNAPCDYAWEASDDGQAWRTLAGTQVKGEERVFRLHRLPEPRRARWLRLSIASAHGKAPVLREVEVFDSPQARVDFPPWCIAVNATHETALPGHGQEFIPLARSAPGWERLEAQQVLLKTVREDFLRVEPRPLCAFISGSFKDWCEVDRSAWRGLEEVLKAGRLPIWASCGGAQGLAILSDTGADKPWDCPHCRDSKNPRTPIYGHIGHTASCPCGDYSGCIFERGLHTVRQAAKDPAFQGLEAEFQVMESHCGQIEYAPRGWVLVTEGGPGTKTRVQCIRRADRYVYAAQFHIEMEGARDSSRRIVGNFLRLASGWGGYNPDGLAVEPPGP